MTRPQARMGDKTDHGGQIVSGALRTLVNGRPVARMGDLHLCPISGHGLTRIIEGNLSCMTEGAPNARMGDKTACGATIIEDTLDTYC